METTACFYEMAEQCIDTDPDDKEELSPFEPSTPPAMTPRFTVVEHDPAWADDFQKIANKLKILS